MKCLECNKEFKKPFMLGMHLKDHNLTAKNYYDKYLKKENEGICYEGNITKFINFSKGYHKYCSVKCRANSPEVQKKIEKKNEEKTGFKNPFLNPEIQKQIRKDRNERTGYSNPMSNPEVQKKHNQTRSKHILEKKRKN